MCTSQPRLFQHTSIGQLRSSSPKTDAVAMLVTSVSDSAVAIAAEHAQEALAMALVAACSSKRAKRDAGEVRVWCMGAAACCVTQLQVSPASQPDRQANTSCSA